MARKKKSRRISDIMPARKSSDTTTILSGRKLSRYELNANAREEKRKKKHKGLTPGSRHSQKQSQHQPITKTNTDSRLGSQKKIPLIIEEIMPPIQSQVAKINPSVELENLENDSRLNQLLDRMEKGESLNHDDQKYVDDMLNQIEKLMKVLGLDTEDDDFYQDVDDIKINSFK